MLARINLKTKFKIQYEKAHIELRFRKILNRNLKLVNMSSAEFSETL